MTGIKKVIFAMAAAATVGGPASAACWSSNVVEAAYIRDFDTTLMVATLRCRAQSQEIGVNYNRFVRQDRAVLTAASDELRTQFSVGKTQKAGLDAFDHFATSLANSHGAGEDGVSCAEYGELVRSAADSPAERSVLLKLAIKAHVNPALPQEACTRQIALAR